MRRVAVVRVIVGAFGHGHRHWHGLVLALVVMLGALGAGCRHEAFCVNCVDKNGGDGDGDGDSGGNMDGGFGNADGGGVGPVDGAVTDGRLPMSCTPRSDGELCNELDDDCDGFVDEDFDLMTDQQHCGACNRPCLVDNAEASCRAGRCQVDACLDGFADLDDDSDCEYRCPVFPGRAEECNGKDDDCDGMIDEALGAPPTGLCRTTPGTPCEGTKAHCATREGVTTWYCEYSSEVEFDPVVPNGIALEETACDGHDGDCDGEVDDPWPIGDACDDGGIGVCKDVGAMACDPNDDTAVVCDLSVLPDAQAPGVELCNNRDDDCDGMIDNGVVDDMVHITTGGDFYIFRYEASHPDATDSAQGLSEARACSNPNVLPWTYVTYDQAQAACTASGKRLCTAAEWQAACGASSYPYAGAYDPNACNGGDRAAGLEPTATLSTCQTGDGVFDLSGNVKEWTNDSPAAGLYVVRGGSHQSPKLGLTCDTTLSQAVGTPGQAAIGFRCCSGTAP